MTSLKEEALRAIFSSPFICDRSNLPCLVDKDADGVVSQVLNVVVR